MKASMLMITIDRFELTVDTWQKNLARAFRGSPTCDIELLVCDNGSKDSRVVPWFAKQNLAYHRVNKRNEGVGKAFNQLYLRSNGDFIAILGNDILMPMGWLEEAVRMLAVIPHGGLIGYDWGHGGVPPLTEKFGIKAHWLTPQLNRVFGSWVFRRSMVEEMGLFHEGYGPYGIEDSDVNERANRLGYNSCYLPDMKSMHLGADVGDQTEYRRMKDESLAANCAIFGERLKKWDAKELVLGEPAPQMRDPLT